MAEQKIGSFESVQTFALKSGTVYETYVTNERLVAVKIGDPMEGGKGATIHFGALGAIIGYFLDKRVQKKRAARRAANAERALDELLLQDKKNFEVRFADLEDAEIKKGKLGFLGGTKANLVLKKPGEKPMELQLVKKEHVAAALVALEPAMQGRLRKDPNLKA
jgi:hypothetical protein